MAFYDKFPYTNFQELNLDELIRRVVSVEEGLQFVIDNASLKYADPIQWDITRQYQANTVVIDPATNIAYISTKPVPDNIQITDTGYWTPIFDLSTFLDDIETQIGTLNTTVEGNTENITQLETETAAINETIEESKRLHYKNVKEYGAVGDGLVDDYQAFKNAYDAADYGSYIIVPHGTYNLSRNPQGDKPITWLIDQGVEFTGAGAGNTASGAGAFGSTYITNPWLETSGLYGIVDTNGRDSAGGVTNAISFEMTPIAVGDGGVLNRDWRNLIYLGANTGNDGDTYNSKGNVEIINEVLNITAQKGIMEELDLNTYASVPSFCTAIFITGGGDTYTDCTAIDIQRDSWLTHWATAISVRQADTVLFAENAVNGFLMNRYDDDTEEGNAFQLRTHDGATELFAIGADGWTRTRGINLIDNAVQTGEVTPTGYIIIRVNGTDHKIAVE